MFYEVVEGFLNGNDTHGVDCFAWVWGLFELSSGLAVSHPSQLQSYLVGLPVICKNPLRHLAMESVSLYRAGIRCTMVYDPNRVSIVLVYLILYKHRSINSMNVPFAL